MKQIGKRALSMMCAMVMLLSMAAMIVPAANAVTGDQIDAIPSQHLVCIRDYSYFSTAPAEGTNYVEDADAYGGKAVCYDKAVLTSHPNISINRYDVASGLGDGNEKLRIGNLTFSELKIDQGYQVYQFTYDVPAETTEGNVFYIMSNWQLNSSQLSKDFAPYAGKTLEVYISMKITGPDGNGHYAVSVDRVALATVCKDYPNEDGTTCTLCGESLMPKDEDVFPIQFRAEDMRLPYAPTDCVVADADSAYGKAALLSYEKRAAMGDAGLLRSMIRTDGLSLAMNTYNGVDSTLVGKITQEQLQENAAKGEYVSYTFEEVTVISSEAVKHAYLFDCWGVQTAFTTQQKEAMLGKKLDVTVSLKVTGDVTSAANPPAYYIDCITYALSDAGEGGDTHQHTCSGFSYLNAQQHSGTCSVCGETVQEGHTWNSGAITVNPTVDREGQKVYLCLVCNGMKTETLPKLDQPDQPIEPDQPEDVTYTFYADDLKLPYGAAMGDTVVEDAESPYGKAALLSYANRLAAGADAGMLNSMIRLPGLSINIYANNGSDILIGRISSEQLQENAAQGGYTAYTFEDVVIVPTDKTSFVYLFDCWGLQARLTEEQCAALKGKAVDVIVSLKVTGDVTSTSNPPAYYIDSITFTTGTSGEGEHSHTCPSYSYVNEKQHSGTCSECGETVLENHSWDEGVVTVEPSMDQEGEKVYTCSVCNGTKTEVLNKLGDMFPIIFYAKDLTLAYGAAAGDQLVEDSDSLYGKAALLSYANRLAAGGDAGLLNSMIRLPGLSLNINANNPSGDILVGRISSEQLQENAAKGVYITYTFENVLLVPTEDVKFVYFFDCWGLQTKFSEEQRKAMVGQLLDVTVSLKVTGDVTSTSNSPAYYIDYVSYSLASQEPEHTHTCPAYTYLDETKHTGTCSECGETIVEYHTWDDGVVTKEPTKEEDGEKRFTCQDCGCTKVETIKKPLSGPLHLIYFADDFTMPYVGIDTVVEDSGSAYGKAALLSYLNRLSAGDAGLTNSMIRTEGLSLGIYTYDGKDSVAIGRLSIEQMQKNGGNYVTYQFRDVELITSDENTFLYMFDCWGLQIRFSAEQLNAMKGMLADVSISMKITGDVSNPDNPPAYYIDRVDIVTKERPSADDPVDITLKAEDFLLNYAPTDSIVADPASKFGQAVKFSYLDRLATGDDVFANNLIYSGRKLEVYCYGADAEEYILLGEFTPEILNLNTQKGGYVVYTFRNVVLAPGSGNYFIYMFNCWGFQARFTGGQLLQLAGKTVDVSISMKIEGDVSNPSNPPAYYIDYVQITDATGESCVHDFSDWTPTGDEEHKHLCYACGLVEKEAHQWEEMIPEEGAEVTDEKAYICQKCGKTKGVEIAPENGIYAEFNADSLTLPYVPMDSVVEDPDSAYGKAVKLSYFERMQAGGDAGMLNSLIRTPGLSIVFHIYDGVESTRLGNLTIEQLKNNGGKYVKYVISDVVVIPDDGEYFMYAFDCWGVQTRFTPEQRIAMMGKTVDIVISMKILGDITDVNNPPTYFIDNIAFTVPGQSGGEGSADSDHIHNYGPCEKIDDNRHGGKCTICGEVQASNHIWNAGELVEEATEEKGGKIKYTCTGCGMTRTINTKKLTPKPDANAGTDGSEGEQPMDNAILVWAICVGLTDLAIVIFIIYIVKKRKKTA